MSEISHMWSLCNVNYNIADWTWGEVELVEELVNLVTGVDATTLIQPWLEEPWNPYRTGETKKKKLVRLICKVKGEEFDETKEIKR